MVKKFSSFVNEVLSWDLFEPTKGNEMITKKPELKTELMFITPTIAKQWLEKNKNNRRIKRHKVTKLRKDIRDGNFFTTHQGVAFNCNGDMFDGQHRLTAISEENVGVWMMVTTGLQTSAVSAIDRGAVRSITDNSKMMGKDVSTRDVAVAYVAMEAPFSISHSGSTTESDVLDFISLHQEAFDAIEVPAKKHLTKAAILAAFLRAFPHCPRTAWDRCLNLYINGIDDSFDPVKEKAIIVLRDLVLGNSGSGYSNSILLYKRAQRAIKGFMNAEYLKLVKPCDQDLYPLTKTTMFE
jgi:hypothetical protein